MGRVELPSSVYESLVLAVELHRPNFAPNYRRSFDGRIIHNLSLLVRPKHRKYRGAKEETT